MADKAEDGASAQPQSRLMIKQMVMHNFKSYHGEKTVGPFHKCFSSVVGPNGSGKSNVIDAMLFVFGYRASKIRQGKLSGLIHNSANHTNLESCSVAVHFQQIIDKGEDDFEVVPNSEVIVSRQAKRDNTSSYTYNGRKMPFKEVAQELRKLGIDLDHNRFLILQGEVEAISMMPPKGKYNEKGDMVDEGMLEYLEDIIGSNVFIEPIKELESKVEELNQDRAMKLSNVKIVEKEKDALESGKNEAEALLSQQNEVTVKQNELFQLYRKGCDDNIQETIEKSKEAQEKFDEANTELKEMQTEMKALGKEHARELKEYKTLQDAAEAARNEYGVFERKDVQLRESRKHLTTKVKKLTKAITTDRSSMQACESEVQNLTEDATRYNGDIGELQEKLAVEEKKVETILEKCQGEKAELKVQLEQRQNELEPFATKVNDEQAKVNILTQEFEIITSNTRAVAQQLEEAKANLATANTTRSTTEAEITDIQKRRKLVEKNLEESKKSFEQLSKSEPLLANKVRSSRARVEDIKSTAGQARAQNKVFKALKATGRKGVFGRLGDLGAIDAKYDCAVTTACGALNNLVVDTVSTGQWCIQYLKEHNIGRVTIICLDKQTRLHAQMDAAFQAPSGTSRLFDLIRPKEDIFRPAFYYGLRNTLVSDTLDHATKVAYGKTKYRVVTLEGQLIDTSGTMSGGGNRAQSGGMSASLEEPMSPKEIAKIEKELEQDVVQLTKQREQRQELHTTVSSLKKELSTFDIAIKKCNMNITAADKAKPELEALVKELTVKASEVKNDSKKQAELEGKLKTAQKSLDKAKKEAQKYVEAVEKVETAIKNVGGVTLKAARSKVKSYTSQIESAQGNITKGNVGLKTAKAKLGKLKKKLQKDEAELEITKGQIEEITEELETMEKGAAEVKSNVKEAQTVCKEKEKSMSHISEQYKTAENQLNELRSRVVDLEEDLAATKAVLKENQTKSKHWSNKINKLTLHKIGSEYDDSSSEEEEEEEEETDEKDNEKENMDVDEAEEDENVQQEGDESKQEPKEKKKKKKQELRTLTDEELDELDQKALERDITLMEERLGGKKVSTQAIKAYYDKEEQYIAKVSELDAVTEERDSVRRKYEDLRKQRLDTFFAGFKKITTKLKEMYQMITLGGDAELEYVDNINPFSEGIVFSVRPPRKSWKAIQNLSGGEKTLSSLALVFALHHYKPTPLYVMDEIDAALDFKNVSIVAHYIKERTKNAQFIIISLRNNMFELADRLVGIYKTDNCTKTVTINPATIAAPGPSVAQENMNSSVSSTKKAVSNTHAAEPLAIHN
eukprot:m.274153 g.274153  ORF g.274153 m.274153 type:complete len:1308 (+) comp16286_c0_seq3:169-4092(+)